ncbi:MAG: SH3 domain-containing protein, partial [Chrysiogenales bacterium]
MNKTSWGYAAVFFLVLFFLIPALQAAPCRVKVSVEMANVRSEPNRGAAAIAQLPRGMILESDETVGDWLRVSFRAGSSGSMKTGYIHKSTVEMMPEAVPKPATPAPVAVRDTRKPSPSRAAPARRGGLVLNILGGAGVTLVDIEKAAGYPSLQDWDTFHYQFKLQGFFSLGALDIGLEAGYNKLYWWYYVGPYGPQTIYREGAIGTWSILALAQKAGNSGLFLQAGGGLHIFSDDSTFGLMAASGYAFR